MGMDGEELQHGLVRMEADCYRELVHWELVHRDLVSTIDGLVSTDSIDGWLIV